MLLSQNGIDFNAQDNKGQTALHLALEHQDRPVVKSILRDSPVDINVRDCEGRAAISCVAFRGDVDYLTGLLTHDKIDVNTRNKDGMTPLMITISRRNVELTKPLCARMDIDVNAQNNWGKTALHYATEELKHDMTAGDMSVVTLMMKLLLSDERTQWLSDYEGNFPKVPNYLKGSIRRYSAQLSASEGSNGVTNRAGGLFSSVFLFTSFLHFDYTPVSFPNCFTDWLASICIPIVS